MQLLCEVSCFVSMFVHLFSCEDERFMRCKMDGKTPGSWSGSSVDYMMSLWREPKLT